MSRSERVAERHSTGRSAAGRASRAGGTLRERVRTVVGGTTGPIAVCDLAEALHAAGGDREYADVHRALYREHLQALDAEGELTFDMETGLVHPATAPDEA